MFVKKELAYTFLNLFLQSAKVNMSEFDETMATLDQNLRDVLDKVEQYSNEEEGLKNALIKLSQDMKDKLDAKAGEALKKYLGKYNCLLDL